MDRLGCIKASEVYVVVVYEDRGETINYPVTQPKKHRQYSRHLGTSDNKRGFVRFRTSPSTHNKDKKAELAKSRQRADKKNSESRNRIRAFLRALGRAAKSLLGKKYPKRASQEDEVNSANKP
ncbi:hypothetical protein EVAR_74323_1 [Eumeta japonica]|uniref:Uncharacterized protein n=1 Tax=Eumeta variegata TaxID=151549 RepID=A0A4C1SDN8_EUMVA|nr:hypothetical protein EVAR_74323_1 [Eumeta japonica]